MVEKHDDARVLSKNMRDARLGVQRLIQYLQGPKFQGAGNDYVYISTDLMPKLNRIEQSLRQE